MPELVADNVVLRRDGTLVLNQFALRIDQVGPTALIGPNGAGKSLALRVLHGLVRADAGQVLLDGARLDRVGRRRQAMVFQRPVLLRRSVQGNIAFALRAAGQSRDRVGAWLEVAGLTEKARQSALSLSGGEAQRLAIARALATEPDVLFLDEPTSALDPAATSRVEALITGAAARGVQVILISHDLGQVRRIAQHVVMMHKGAVVEEGPVTQMLDAPQHADTAAFVAGELLL